MIGSVAASKRAAAFARALDEREHELDEATAADRTAEEQRTGALLSAPSSPPAPGVPPSGGWTAAGAANAAAPAEYPSDEADSPSDDEEAQPETLLGITERLRSVPRPTVAPDVKIVQRARLVAAMEAEFASPEARARQIPAQRDTRGTRKGAHRAPALGPLSKLRPNSRLGKGIAAGGLGVGVAASALGGVAAASNEALPGDSLYGVKRGMEDLRLDFANDEADRGQVHLDRAATRLREARRLMERARGGAELDEESVSGVRRALALMRYDASEGHRLLSAAYAREGSIDPMRSLSSFNSAQQESWAQLREHLPPQCADVRDEVTSVFDSMDSDIAPIAGLISRHDDASSQPSGHGGPESRDRAGGTPRSSPSGSGGTGADAEDGSGSPSPSGTDRHTGELIGGAGLLEPSGDPDGQSGGSGTGSAGGEDGRDSRVTLPPIVPDILPGLKKLSEHDQ